MSDKIKRFIDCHMPVTTCNLRCHYCYITQNKEFDKALPIFDYSPKQIVKALSKKRFGGVCVFNICGDGETLLPPEILPITRGLLEEGHYVNLITNGTFTKRFDEFLEFPKDLLERLFFKFSFHYLEFKRLNLFETFISNVLKMRAGGCSVTIEVTPSDELIPYIDEIMDFSLKNFKALPHITVARNNKVKELPILSKLSKEDYKKTWGKFDSVMFDHKIEFFGHKRNEFCYAGEWTGYILLGTGELKKCYCGETLEPNLYENPDKPIIWDAIGYECPEAHCFNSHAWLTFGNIPELKTPTYEQIRNRICVDGYEWLGPKIKEVFSQKLYQNNKKYSLLKKLTHNKKTNTRKLIQQVFSVKNLYSNEKKHKIVSILGLKIKLRVK